MLRDPACETLGYYVAGKYFQNAAVQEPYVAITAAFSPDLCDLIIQSDGFCDKKLRQRIADVLGSDTQLHVNAITNLTPFLRDDVKDIGIEASFAKFKIAIKVFLHAMASEKHPVVLFLDDVQWADEGSRQLIQMFLQDLDLKNVMIILPYRDEESAHVNYVLLDHARNPTDIALSNLDVTGVCQLVTSMLLESPDISAVSDHIRDLSDLVARRIAYHGVHGGHSRRRRPFVQ
jgi:predicted ATPase